MPDPRGLILKNGKIDRDLAEMMGINSSTLRNKMNKVAIPYGRGKSVL